MVHILIHINSDDISIKFVESTLSAVFRSLFFLLLLLFCLRVHQELGDAREGRHNKILNYIKCFLVFLSFDNWIDAYLFCYPIISG